MNLFEDSNEKTYEKIFSRLKQIDEEFSLSNPDSELSRVNEAAGKSAVSVSSDLYFVLQKALFYAEISCGLFDPTVGPLVKLWGIGTEKERVPSSSEIKEKLSFVNYRDLLLSDDGENNTVFLSKEGMCLDLGGIAKGFAADEIEKILLEKKVKRAVVNLGGNVYVHGKKKKGEVWNIGVKNPFDKEGEPCAVVSLSSSSSVVTSGSYERFFVRNGITYHHIINPKTGYPFKGKIRGATIVSPSSCDADALSTICFMSDINDVKEILSLVRKENSWEEDFVNALLVTDSYKIFVTRDLKERVSPYAPGFSVLPL